MFIDYVYLHIVDTNLLILQWNIGTVIVDNNSQAEKKKAIVALMAKLALNSFAFNIFVF